MKKYPFLPAFILLLACNIPRTPIYKDISRPVEERVEDLFKKMTLEEKVAQLYPLRIVDSLAWDEEGNFISTLDTTRLNQGIGAFWAMTIYSKAPRERAQYINSIQKYLVEKSRLGIPAFVFAEGLHGYLAPGGTSFPQAIALGSTWDTALIRQVYSAASLEASACGVTQFLSPVVDLAREPRWGRTEECFGEDPYLVSRMGLAAVYGFQGGGESIDSNHAAVTLKHFAGHGQPEGGRNIAPVNCSEREFRESHLYPFEVAVKMGKAQSIMVSYNEWDGVPNHINHYLLTEILRDEWGFDGFVMSDGGGLDVTYKDHLAAKDSAESGILSLLAGIDYDLGSRGCFAVLDKLVADSLVPAEAIDRAVKNVLRVKFRCGLFDNPYVNLDRIEEIMNCNEHKALALKAACEGIILLKNEGHILPLDSAKIKTLAVIGPNAADIHLGGYSGIPMKGVSVLEGITEFAGDKIKVLYAEGCKITLNETVHWIINENPILSTQDIDEKLIKEAVITAKKSNAVLLVLGENELINREAWSEKHLGDVDHLNLVGRREKLAMAILATGKPVIVLLINGRPLSINYLAQYAPAILEGWYLGQETGHAFADVLFGEVNPSGKLTVTIPGNVGQLPCYYNRKPSRFREYVNSNSTPLFPFGFGLSYTDFKYNKLRLSRKEIAVGDSLEVFVNIANIGSRNGDEIVQLYIHDLISLPTRPVKELKDFARITLKAGESKKVTFLITPEKLEAFNLDMEREVQPGEFVIMVGKNSSDFLSDTLLVR
ncbi:MAG: glycoside hydrolase family 3 C-terminal domain-containing protein [Bacteroidales bacterium]|nr:glycoside hydrolase family 3 C-terminal domain-containing protein [Bacteroidales bacterium]